MAELAGEIVECRRCPRLVEWRERVAVEFFAGPEPAGAVVHRGESAEGETEQADGAAEEESSENG